jgi:pilus assembly protein CpaE
VTPGYSLADALDQIAETGQADLAALVAGSDGIEVLPAPATPVAPRIDPDRLHELLESARDPYDWIVVDLPGVFEKLSLLTMSDCDEAFLVTTAELPSLHMTRKAVAYLGLIGFGPDRYRVVVNRMGKADISTEEMGKIFGAPVDATFPNDYLSIHKSLTTGSALGPKCPLGRSVESFSGQLVARAELDRKKAGTAAQVN